MTAAPNLARLLQCIHGIDVQNAANIVAIHTLQQALLCRLAHDAGCALIAAQVLKRRTCRTAECHWMTFLGLIKRLQHLQTA